MAVRDAALLCTYLVHQVDPERAVTIREAMSTTPGSAVDVREAGQVFTRILQAICREVV
jgi:hypothetical protein